MTKMKDIEKLNWNCSDGCDVGGMMQEWLQKQVSKMRNTDEIRWTNKEFHTEKIYFIKHLWSCSWDETEIPEKIKGNEKLVHFLKNDLRNIKGKYFCEIYDNVFLHYRAGGNWRKEGLEFHKYLTQQLKAVLL